MGKQFVNDKILVVDDFPNMRMSLKRMLTELGETNVEFASNGEDAIKLMRQRDFDIVLCDYNLEHGKDGQQVLEEARFHNYIRPSCIFIMITAETSVQYVLGAVQYQPDEYIIKPFTKEILSHRLKRAVEREAALHDIRELVNAEQYEEAVEQCEQRIAEKTKYSIEVFKTLGEIYFSTGDFNKAIELYERVLAIRNFPWAKFGLAKAISKTQNFRHAAETLDSLLADNPRYLEAYDLLAHCYRELSECDRAQEALLTAVELAPKSVRRQRELGDVSRFTGDHETAERAYRAAIRHGEYSCFKGAHEYNSLAKMLVEAKKTHKAQMLLKNAQEALRDNPDELVNIACGMVEVLVQMGSEKDAKQALGGAVKLFRRHLGSLSSESKLSVARANLLLDEEETAKGILREIVCNRHEDQEAMDQVRATAVTDAHKQMIEALIESESTGMTELNTRGIALVKEGKLQEAVELFQEVADRVPQNKAFNLNAAQVMIQLMQEQGAQPALLYKTREYLLRVTRLGQKDERHKELLRLYKGLSAA